MSVQVIHVQMDSVKMDPTHTHVHVMQDGQELIVILVSELIRL